MQINLEIPATLCGVLNVYYAARAHFLNWFFGIITVTLYIVIFFHAKLYADMSLQMIFLCLQFYGIYCWRQRGSATSGLVVTQASKTILTTASVAVVVLFALISYLLKQYTDSTTVYLDAMTTALGLVAQWMFSKKWLENWYVWIGVDILSINMCCYKHLYLTSFLYFVFLLLSILGFLTWRKKVHSHVSSGHKVPSPAHGND